jgi:hypothetical protein
MGSLDRRYVQCINTTYCRTGTLWDSRRKSSLIQTESDPACLDMELNPDLSWTTELGFVMILSSAPLREGRYLP